MNRIDLSDIESVAIYKGPMEIGEEIRTRIDQSFSFLKEFAVNKTIYGINTGFGPMAQYKIDEAKLDELQYNLIRSHSSGTGNALADEEVRAVMMARIVNFLQGNSGVSPQVIDQLVTYLNRGIYPEIYEHGGVGASGDLVQLAHLALALIGEGFVRFNGQRRPTGDVLAELGIAPHRIQLRDGLGIMNGTSCMTGLGSLNIIYAYRLLNWSVIASAIINELVEAFDDSFSEGLNAAKRHQGQSYIAREMREFLEGSRLINKREDLFSGNGHADTDGPKNKVQEYYSVRCVPQILGPVKETIDVARAVIESELNSTNDNPVVSVNDHNVYHGGNFHGDYVSLEMDKLKIVVAKATMLAERQLNFLLNSNLNERFPAFLNPGIPGLNFGIQGIQYTATSTTAESQMLCNPMYIHSIPNNNDNQDIVSMGTNSAIIARRVIENGFQVMAVHMLAVCQAIDLLSEEKKEMLAPRTRAVHQTIRKIAPVVAQDRAQSENIRNIILELRDTRVKL